MGPPFTPEDREPDPRITELVNLFFNRRQAGEDVTPESFAAEHPEAAEQIRLHLAGLPMIDQVCLSNLSGEPDAAEDSPKNLLEVKGYRLVEEIGRGGMGIVYKAIQLSTKRVVALKLMLPSPFSSPAARRRFDREVELAARLQHAGIVRVLESSEAAGRPYYSMDYVQGTRLDQYAWSPERDCRTILPFFIRLCEAVQYAHEHGVIHRDLKPANILVDAEVLPHILDFGLAKGLDEAELDGNSRCLSSPGQVLGTLFYMAPEQAAGELSRVDARTDIYALGLILYEVLTGSLPLDTAGRPSDIIRRIIESPPTPASKRSAGIEPDLEIILLKALEKDQALRYQSARELADDLRRYLNGEPIGARRPSRIYVFRKRLGRHPLAAWATVAAIVMLLALGGLRAWQARRDTQQARLVLLACQQQVEAGKAAEAIGPAQAILDKHPELQEASLVYAQTLYRLYDTGNPAVVFLERRRSTNPGQELDKLLLAEMYRAKGKPTLADGLNLPAEASLPNSAEALYLRSFATLDIPNALRCVEEAVRLEPLHKLAWERLTYLRLQSGDLAGAMDGVDQMIRFADQPLDWIMLRGHLLAKQGRLEEALAEYTRVGAYVYRAHVYRRLRKYEEAIADYTRCFALDSAPSGESVWVHYQRATPLWILGRAEEALADYRHVRTVLGRPSYGDARAYVILRDLGRRQEADDLLAAALRDTRDPWLRQIFDCLAGSIPPDDLVAQALTKGSLEQVCEATYYAGETSRMAGHEPAARQFFESCLRTALLYDPDAGVQTPMNEYELAQWRLESVGGSPTSSQP
ncbi:MAG TPA: protein kinase [Phycisphaerae bacterium]|nr:protein kinase [Phycisphaerae bacterium]